MKRSKLTTAGMITVIAAIVIFVAYHQMRRSAERSLHANIRQLASAQEILVGLRIPGPEVDGARRLTIFRVSLRSHQQKQYLQEMLERQSYSFEPMETFMRRLGFRCACALLASISTVSPTADHLLIIHNSEASIVMPMIAEFSIKAFNPVQLHAALLSQGVEFTEDAKAMSPNQPNDRTRGDAP